MTNTRRSRRRVSTALCAALALTTTVTACAKTPDQEAFYTDAVAASGTPGTLVRSRVSKVSGNDKAKAWQVVYRSTSATGQIMGVSGTVMVPTAAWTGFGPRPVVSYGVGTRGLGDKCAPSYSIANGGDYESGIMTAFLDKGYAVVVTDMQGLGTPGIHTYMVGKSQGAAALDIARVAVKMPETGLAANAPVGIVGYSQGGATSAWAAELQPTYAPEMNLKGAVMGGVPADLMAVAEGLDGSTYVAFGLLAAVGYDAAYPELKLQSYMNDAGKKLYTDAQSMCLVSLSGMGTFLGVSGKKLTDYTTTDPRTTAVWKQRLGENRLGSNKPTVPVFQYHGQKDQIVVFPQASALRQTYCSKGANVTWKALPNDDHISGIFAGKDDSVAFLAARFSGMPTLGNC